MKGRKPYEISIKKEGAFLMVTQSEEVPVADEVVEELNGHYIENIDVSAINFAIEKRNGVPIKVGNVSGRTEIAKLEINVSPDEMEATLKLREPLDGKDSTFDEIMAELSVKGVRTGIDEDEIKRVISEKKYSEETVVAKGTEVANGEDAVIEYKFNQDKEKFSPKEDETGKVDFKELNLIDNVVMGQVLAVKIPPTIGKLGVTVTGRELTPSPGKDVQMPQGKNTQVSADGLELTAVINGQVIWSKNKISVDPVYSVKEVGPTTGNVVFTGKVIISTNVADTFNIKASGDVEIGGTVGRKCIIESEGSIMIRNGVLGKDETVLRADGDIYAKFLENVLAVEALGNVIVGEAILHSNVDAGGSVIVSGRRGTIVGGRIRATKEINAKVIGSAVSTYTEVEVGTNPKVRQQLIDMEQQLESDRLSYNKVKMGITTLKNLKEKIGQLPEDKEKLLLNLNNAKNQLLDRLQEITDKLNMLKAQMSDVVSGRVCVSQIVYSNVNITIQKATLNVKEQYKFVSFLNDGGNIKLLPYEEPKLPKKTAG